MFIFLLLSLLAASVRGLGINLGNVLEAPHEGDWAPAADETYFDDYVTAGFSLVRVPVRWDKHAATSPPYAIDGAFRQRTRRRIL
jgi:endoglucanase